MKRLKLWLAILLALALSVTAIVMVLGDLFLPLLVLLGFLGTLLYVGAFLARSKHLWLVGVLGAAIGAPLGWFMGGWDAAAVLTVTLGLAGLLLCGFVSAVNRSGNSWGGSRDRDRQYEEIFLYRSEATGFFPGPSTPARKFKRMGDAPASTGHDPPGPADTVDGTSHPPQRDGSR